MMREALTKAAEQFRMYEREHRAKAEKHRHTASHATEPMRENRLDDAFESDRKAEVNGQIAEMCERALASD